MTNGLISPNSAGSLIVELRYWSGTSFALCTAVILSLSSFHHHPALVHCSVVMCQSRRSLVCLCHLQVSETCYHMLHSKNESCALCSWFLQQTSVNIPLFSICSIPALDHLSVCPSPSPRGSLCCWMSWLAASLCFPMLDLPVNTTENYKSFSCLSPASPLLAGSVVRTSRMID